MRIALYAHGGSGNHGCEALVRSTIKVIGNQGNTFVLASESPDEDHQCHLDELATIVSSQSPLRGGLRGLLYRLRMKISHDDRIYYREVYRSFTNRLEPCDIAIAIGGDNYCYHGFPERFGILNDMLQRRGIPTVLWGCSIDPYRINPSMLVDLRKYQFITARESLTYEALVNNGINNVHLIPDTAFLLEEKRLPLPPGMEPGQMVGINISPLLIKKEPSPGITFDNYSRLIQHILSTTSMGVLLVPHVVWKRNDDRRPLLQLYEKFKDTHRIAIVDDCGAQELKGYVSRCRFMVAARTHASIAGYSTSVPTLVVGYSVKAEGIALDLFGTTTHYVTPIASLNHPDVLTDAFKWLQTNETAIRQCYQERLQSYLAPLSQLPGILKEALQ